MPRSAFEVETADGHKEKRLILSSIEGLHEQVQHLFMTNKTGILCFVNGHEPCAGELPIDVVSAKIGDEVHLAYLGFQIKNDPENEEQGKLF